MFPAFRYHPDPLFTNSVKRSTIRCLCCGQNRDYIYIGPVYSEAPLDESICPWCIADGTAAERFDCQFSDDHSLLEAGISKQIVEEVTRRTPGYASWQSEDWKSCCDDACEFHGDASLEELRSLSSETLHDFLELTGWSAADFCELLESYSPGGSPAIYKFVCRHCRRLKFAWDCD